jgi:hypothetical protein
MKRDRDVSVQINLRAAFSDLASVLYYIENAYNITEDELLASALLLMHSDMCMKAKTIQGIIEDINESAAKT